MAQVTVLFKTDQWHSHSSKKLIGVFSTKGNSLKYLKKVFKLKYTDIDDIYHQGQTQGLDENYVLETHELNQLNRT